MDVTTITGQASASQRSGASLAQDFDTFLTLLTTQLQNQDPLSPLDTNEFTAQLVQFSSVEQAIQTNQNLESLLAMTQAASAGSAVSYLGKQVTTLGNQTNLQNGVAEWNYKLEAQSEQTGLVIEDSAGKIVYVTQGETFAGDHTFTWNGNDNSGQPLPDGLYTLKVSAHNEANQPITVQTSVSGLVTGVDFKGAEPLLKVGDANFSLLDILTIEEITPSE